MRHRAVLLILLASAALSFWGGAAWATIYGTSHDISTAAGGACGACHIPHAGTSRVWVVNPVSKPAPAAYVGTVAPLCGYCHYPNMGGCMPDAESRDYVYGTNSHGRLMNTSTLPGGHVASNLQYMTDGADGDIECTSCHNPHDDTNRPFLEAGINEICSLCHGYRRQSLDYDWIHSGGYRYIPVGSWGAIRTEDNNPGSHPVGTDITGDVYNGASPIAFPAFLSVGVTAGPDGWTLGGHLTGGRTGGVVCVTCHAVHGVRYDRHSPGQGITPLDDSPPNPNFLTVRQAAVPMGGRMVANGAGDFNALCEACHVGKLSASYGLREAPGIHPNPGGASFGHPVDGMFVAVKDDLVVGFPPNWPSGRDYGRSAATPTPICESCHAPHAYADSLREDNPFDSYPDAGCILRDSHETLCGDCHRRASSPQPAGGAFVAHNWKAKGAPPLATVVPSVSTAQAGSVVTPVDKGTATRVVVQLTDGSRIPGNLFLSSVSLRTGSGVATIPIGRIEAIRIRRRLRDIVVRTWEKDLVYGSMEGRAFPVQTVPGGKPIAVDTIAWVFFRMNSPPASLPDGLVVHYPFDGDALPKSGGFHAEPEYKGVINRAAPAQDRFGNSGGALRFDGKNTCFYVPRDPLLPPDSDVTFSFWFNAEGLKSWIKIVDCGLFTLTINGWRQRIETFDTRKLHLSTREMWEKSDEGRYYRPVKINLENRQEPDVWHHFALTHDGKSIRAYFDGALVAKEPLRRDDLWSYEQLVIGDSPPLRNVFSWGTWGAGFTGAIDDVMVFKRALSEKEIRRLYKP